MTTDNITSLVDRIGAPMALILVILWVTYTAIKGPGMRLAELAGGALAELAKAAVSYLGAATQRIGELPSHVTAEAVSTREVVRAEASATRAHVTDAVERIRDRVSDAENEITRSVTATGSHPAITATPPAGLPLTARVG